MQIKITLLILLIFASAYVGKSKKLPSVPYKIPLAALIWDILSDLITYSELNLPGMIMYDWFSNLLYIKASVSILNIVAIVKLSIYLLFEVWPVVGKVKSRPKIIKDLVFIISSIVATIVVLQRSFGISLTGLFTTSAILTAIVGLAAQATLKNFLAGLTLRIDPPFKEDDWIDVDVSKGTVVALTMMNTQLRGSDGSLIVIPNEQVSMANLRRFSSGSPFGNMFTVGFDYIHAPSVIIDLLIETVKRHPKVLHDPAPSVWVDAYAESSIIYQVLAFHYEASTRNQLQMKSDLLDMIWHTAKRNHINVPYPKRELVYRYDGTSDKRDWDTDKIADLLLAQPIFSSMSQQQIEFILDNSRVGSYAQNEIIMAEGDDGDSLYLILDGVVEVWRNGPDHSKITLSNLASGSIIGEMTLLTGQSRQATVQTKSMCLLLEVKQEPFLTVLEQDSTLMSNILELVSKRQIAIKESSDSINKFSSTKNSVLEKIKKVCGLT